jgi:hypothetical protein
MTFTKLFLIVLYCALNFWSVGIGFKDLENSEWPNISIGSILFPLYYIPYVFILLFYLNLTMFLNLFKKKEYCRCRDCGTTHTTFKGKISKELGLK